MRKVENDLGCRKRSSTRPFRITLEGPPIDRYRVMLTYFIIGCLATFLISGVRDVYGADISLPVRLDSGSVPVGEASENSFDIKNTAKSASTIITILQVPKWAPPNYGWWELVSDGCSGRPLYKGNSCTLTYRFSPPAVNSYDYTLNIPYTYDGKTINNANTHFYGTGIKGTPTVSWPTTSGITYGQPLSASTLTGGSAWAGTTKVEGMFAFTNPSYTPGAGAYSASVTFTPNDLINYNTVVGNVNVAVAQASPGVTTWPTASGEITYGLPLSACPLTGGSASVEGIFTFTNPGTVPDVGTHSFPVTFTPTSNNYSTASGSVSVTVVPATPIVTTWPTASGITYGQPLSASTLTGGSASVKGTFSFTNPSYTPNAGTYSASVTFSPDDPSHYNTVTGSVNVAVAQATVTVTWDNPADITHPTPLTAIQLNATASVEGTFNYSPTSCTELPVGEGQILSVTFTPNDPNYKTASATVTINVLKPYVTKEQVYDKWVCTQRAAGSGFPIAMYLCPDSDCDSCIGVQPRCGNSSLADVEFDVNELRWAGPTNETVDLVTPSIIYRCMEDIDLVFSCGVNAPPWVCKPDAPNLLNTPTVTTKMVQKIGNVWACSEVPDESGSGCLTEVYSCSNATDLNPCPCGDLNDPNRKDWVLSTFEAVTFNEGELRAAGPGSDDPSCQAVYFVTSKILGSAPNWCIYKCISDPNKCIPSEDPDNPYCCFSYCNPE